MSAAQEQHEQTTKADTGFLGQPRALANVFGVEMWERFSFYGMQGILLIYLYFSVADGGLGLPQALAGGIVGAYAGSVYLSTILGAWLADRLFGSEKVLYVSAWVIVAGHLALALLPGLIGVGVGLVLIALGSGGLKANATSVVGSLYAKEDPRRDAGFSVFYLGINLGSFFGPIVTGWLQSKVGFHWGFGAAAVGMTIGLIQYGFGRRSLPASVREVPNPLPRSRYRQVVTIAVAALLAVAALIAVGVIRADNLAGIVIVCALAATIAYFAVILSSKQITSTERSRVWAFVPLFITSVAFWSLYQQQFTVITVYSAERVNRHIFGYEMPISWVQAINPVFIIVFSGIFAALWSKLGNRQPSTPAKFALGTMVMGGAFLLFLFFANGAANSTPLLAIVGILFTFTVAELMLSPIGLSAATKLAPARFQTQMVALFFLSISLGSAISGWLVQFYNPKDEVPYFATLGIIAIAVGLGLALMVKPVRRLMRGVS